MSEGYDSGGAFTSYAAARAYALSQMQLETERGRMTIPAGTDLEEVAGRYAMTCMLGHAKGGYFWDWAANVGVAPSLPQSVDKTWGSR
jgi:hypothetical protein